VVEVDVEVQQGVLAVGDVIKLVPVGDGSVEVPDVEDREDVFAPLPVERAGPGLAPVEQGVGDLRLAGGVARVTEGPLVAGDERPEDLEGRLGQGRIY
jgi:hypothetical protein